ncbi:amino acid adenylation domain-containing protein [Corallococcus sp. ZKHCc1 1396]|uniref:Amino acid adenylation domain-containing protein n=1 Tax=Corallococcus soli TaxID=2710757 RepID=A0ABR9PV52_9BACT|nr:non-ribosomal peptide synthetase [Corallococcus soli]MBE4751754.1 amino acid adenylation domain-containing protein [Corallococcus soli]
MTEAAVPLLEFVTRLRQLEVKLWLEQDQLKCSAPRGVLTGELRASIGARKAELIGLLREARASTRAAPSRIPKAPRTGALPLSFAQQRLWFFDQLEPDSPVYNIASALRLRGTLDVRALQAACTALVERHEVLRTTFQSEAGRPFQVIAPPGPHPLPVVSLESHPPSEREAVARGLAGEEARRPFSLSRGPLLRTTLLRLAPDHHILLMTLHHIVTDAGSDLVLHRELAQLYAAARTGTAADLPALPIQYADFALWQRQWLQGEVLEAQLDYWRKQLADAPTVLELPTDRPRPPTQTYRGDRHTFELSADLTRGLRALSQREDATLAMTLLTGFAALLHRYTGQEDLLIGSPIAGRHHVETEGLLGFFVNTVVLRSRTPAQGTFQALLQGLREASLGAYAHQDLPYETLVEKLQHTRDLSRGSLFQVMFGMAPGGDGDVALPGLTLEPMDVESRVAHFDLIIEFEEQQDHLVCRLKYNSDLFDADTLVRMGHHLRRLFEAAVATPGIRLTNLPLLPPEEEQRVLRDWNATTADFQADTPIHELIEAQAVKAPAAPAVMVARAEGHGAADLPPLTYGELDARSNQLARHLRTLGVGPEVRVALCFRRSPEAIVAMLAVLKAGGVYVPLDPQYPGQRLAFVIEDTQPRVLLTHQDLLGVLPTPGAETRVLCLDLEAEQLSRRDASSLERNVAPDNLVYVIYTSGSTGQPKGVMISHRGLQISNTARLHFYRAPARRYLLLSSFAFDSSVAGIFWTLTQGGMLVLPEEDLQQDTMELVRCVDRLSLTHLLCVPTFYQQLVDAAPPGRMRSLEVAIVAGETMPHELIQTHTERFPQAGLFTEYGATESSVYTTIHRYEAGGLRGRVPVGRPVENNTLYVLDARMRPVPIGVKGEVFLGGAGVARGYYGRPELSARSFVPDPFSREPGARLYRTGDLGRFRADGVLEFLGRIDQQVKVRGYRIELEEIEAALAQHPALQANAVAVREDLPGNPRLVAYVVPRAGGSGTGHEGTSINDAQLDRVSQFQTMYDQLYGHTEGFSTEDPSINHRIWIDTYDHQPIPLDVIHEVVDDTVQRILALKPKRVLEIGVGTGLLLLRIAPSTERYLGVDFSETALDRLRTLLAGRPAIPGVSLRQGAAHEADRFREEPFDVVVINEVSQHFPSLDYCVEVLEKLVSLLRPGGHVFIGGVRPLPLLELFHASVQLHRAGEDVTRDAFERTAREHLVGDKDLCIDPAFFRAVREHIPAMSQVWMQLKGGRHRNELTRFKYDVFFQVNGPRAAPREVEWLDWGTRRLTLAEVRAELDRKAPEVLALANVPNARLSREQQALALFKAPGGPSTVGELRRALASLAFPSAEDPQDFQEAARAAGYDVIIDWAGEGRDAAFNAVFHRRPGRHFEVLRPAAAQDRAAPTGWSAYANDPLREQAARALIPTLRDFLQRQLPAYMVPSAFVVLDALPLNPNGKVDRKALPAPEPTRQGPNDGFVAPRNDVEARLAAIWAQVLRRERVSVHDNFFDLGGDSILSVQIVARATQAGLRLTARQMFAHQTLAELATVVGSAPVALAEPEFVTGEVPLTPVQRWYVSQGPQAPHHFNQTVLLLAKEPLRVEWLEQAVRHIVRHHDALRMRFESTGSGWSQRCMPPDDLTAVEHFELAHLRAEQQPAALEAIATRLQGSLSLEQGPLLRVARFTSGQGEPEHLLLIAHHLVVDGLSWRILLEDLQTAYQQLREGRAVHLPAKTSSFQRWSRRLVEYARTSAPPLEYWRGLPTEVSPLLPADLAATGIDSWTVGTSRTHSQALGQEETQALLREVLKAFHCEINDVLLTALASALASWTGRSRFLIDLEGHGREPLFDDVDLSRTVGWFTSLFPVVLEHEGDDLLDTLHAVKARLRGLPNRGIDYGILRYLREAGSESVPELHPSLVFNYLGQFDQVFSGDALFQPSDASVGPTSSPHALRPHLLEVNSLVHEGRLRVNWTYSPALHLTETVTRLSEHFLQTLRRLVVLARTDGARRLSPSDFPLARVDRAGLDRLLANRGPVEDVYPLALSQQEMFEESRARPGTWAYAIQISGRITGALSPETFERACQHVIDRHPVLRSAVVFDGVAMPHQVVQREARLTVERIDLTRLPPAQHPAELARRKQDTLRGFDLERAPLMRLALVQCGPERYHFVWSTHHGMLDGWCMSLLLQEVFAVYAALARGAPVDLPARTPFREVLRWLERQDLAKAEAYWRRELAGLALPTHAEPTGARPGWRWAEKRARLSKDTTEALSRMARRHRLTLNTVVQGAWALVLGHARQRQEVCFGATSVVRPAEVPGVEGIIGPLLNTLPVRARWEPELSAAAWLAALQARQQEQRPFEHVPLSTLRRWMGAPEGLPLFDSIVRFQNYPMQFSADGLSLGFGFDRMRVIDRWPAPLALIVVPGEQLKVELGHRLDRVDTEQARHLMERFRRLLTLLANGPEQRLAALMEVL